MRYIGKVDEGSQSLSVQQGFPFVHVNKKACIRLLEITNKKSGSSAMPTIHESKEQEIETTNFFYFEGREPCQTHSSFSLSRPELITL